jgi:hypothetical protein
MNAAALDLGQTSQPLRLQQFAGALQFGEVLLQHGVGLRREILRTQFVDGRAKFPHDLHPPSRPGG